MAAKQSLARLHQLLALHETLLSDGVRNRAFHRALRARVRASTSVLDIGAGTGLWAVVAAQLGARRVVAVEKEPLLVPLIERLARDNGVADRIEIVRGDSRKVSLGERFDLIVSETVGNEAFEEGILPIVADARRRFLRRGGRVIPEALALMAAPVRVRRLAAPAGGLPVRTGHFESLALHFPRSPGRRRLRLMAAPVSLLRVRLASARAPVAVGELRGRWSVADVGRVNAVALWVEMRLAPAVRLSTLGGTHWTPTLLGLERPGAGPGTLALRFDPSPESRQWEIVASTRRGTRAEVYSGLFAYGAVRAPLTVATGRG